MDGVEPSGCSNDKFYSLKYGFEKVFRWIYSLACGFHVFFACFFCWA